MIKPIAPMLENLKLQPKSLSPKIQILTQNPKHGRTLFNNFPFSWRLQFLISQDWDHNHSTSWDSVDTRANKHKLKTIFNASKISHHHRLSCCSNYDISITNDGFRITSAWMNYGNSRIFFNEKQCHWKSNYIAATNYNSFLSFYSNSTSW